jgi:CheY-like chemotaxis protein
MPEGERSPRAFRILAVDADPALQELLAEWLAPRVKVVASPAEDFVDGGPVDLIIVDLQCPRMRGTDCLKRVACAYPRTPIVAVSSRFFAGVETSGALARTLGVAAVLSKPVDREALMRAVDRLLERK